MVLLIANDRLVEEAYRNRFGEEGYVAFLVSGREGDGKTSYALWLGFKVYRDWDLVLKHLYFNPLPALRDFEKALDQGRRLKYVIFDDAGLWISKYETFKDYVIAFIKFYNIIRSVVASTVFTSPSDEIHRMLREKAWLRLIVEPLTRKTVTQYDIPLDDYGLDLEKPYSLARVYELNISPTLERYVKRKHLEIFPRHYPVHGKYVVKRREAIKEKIGELKEMFSKEIGSARLSKVFALKCVAWFMVKVKGLSLRKAAKELGVSHVTVRKWANEVEDMVSTL